MIDDIDAALAEILPEIEGDGVVQPELFDWPEAKTQCWHVLAAIKNLPGYRLGMASASTVDLAYEFAVVGYLVDLFAASEGAVAHLAGDAIAQMRDICAAEGIRRGVILAIGDDAVVTSMAVQIMDEMILSFTPSWATGL